MTITKVEFLDNYQINIWLENGISVACDFQNRVKTARFADLQDQALFKEGKVTEGKNIYWNEMTEISLSEILQKKELEIEG